MLNKVSFIKSIPMAASVKQTRAKFKSLQRTIH